MSEPRPEWTHSVLVARDRDGGGWASAIVVGCITGIVLTTDRLPETVATHFAASGAANGWMPRSAYVAVIIGLAVILPAVVGLLTGAAVRRFPELVNVPHREHWLAADRRERTANLISAHVVWLAAALGAFGLAMHLLVIRANLHAPAQLETGVLMAMLGGLSVALVAWITTLQRRFRRA